MLKIIKKLSKKDSKKDEKDETNEVELDEDGNAIEEPEKEDEVDEKTPSECTEWRKELGPALKMGTIQDAANRDRLMKLLRFKSSKNEDANSETRTLQDYVDNVK